MKRFILFPIILFWCSTTVKSQTISSTESDTNFVQIALLIDVSGSMQGLLSQTQTQIWQMLNYTDKFRMQGEIPITEIAILTYGNQYYEENGHINLISDFTTDFDSLAEKLFILETGGGNEYCGMAIQYALDHLNWKDSTAFKCLFIAGNEPFSQGALPYPKACANALRQKILINTIFCGGFEAGIQMEWEQGAIEGGGGYTNMDMDMDLEKLQTPFDNRIVQLYQQYSQTYFEVDVIHYTPSVNYYINDGEVSPAYRDMLIYKYKHLQREEDFLDHFELGNWNPDLIKKASLPKSWQGLGDQELRQHLFKQSRRREVLKESLDLYIDKMEEYLLVTVGPQLKENTLDLAIRKIIKDQLIAFGFEEVK